MNEELILDSLKRIEKNQKEHARETDSRLRSIEERCAVLVTQQANDDVQLERLDTRVSKAERKLWQIGGVISFLSASAVVIADKFLNGGGS